MSEVPNVRIRVVESVSGHFVLRVTLGGIVLTRIADDEAHGLMMAMEIQAALEAGGFGFRPATQPHP